MDGGVLAILNASKRDVYHREIIGMSLFWGTNVYESNRVRKVNLMSIAAILCDATSGHQK